MAKIIKIEDETESILPLRVTRRKATKRRMPHLRVKCGCCDEAFQIYFDDPVTGNPHSDFLEINGVYGTIAQWRKLLLPLLQIAAEE